MTGPDDLEPLRRDNISAFDAAPRVGGASSPWVVPVGVAGAVVLGVVVFSMLNASRLDQERADARREEVARVEPPAARIESPIAPLYPDQIEPEEEAPLPIEGAPMQAAVSAVDERLRSAMLIIDLSEPAAAGAPSGPSAPAVAGAVAGDTLSGDERFAARFGGAQTAQARWLANPSTTVPQGVIMAGVLETAINSDLPGYVRALVTRDVRSFDGSTLLVPRGSRLIGQYRSGVALGQSRAFVIWTRLIRPDGAVIDLNSPGSDALGRGGLEGETDRHFFQRFGGAILLTLLSGAVDAVADDDDTQVVIGVARGGGDAAAAALSEEINISPTIRVRQGTPIRIFVSRDLDFSGVGGAAP
jgi:type IV secretion system protein VirB10